MLVRTEEAAKRLKLSVSLITKLRCRGEGPAFIRLGRIVVYDTDDLESWVKARRIANDNGARERRAAA